MTWTRISDTFNDDPLYLRVSRSARLLHVEALVYCNKHTLDGAMPRGALPRITDAEDPHADLAELLAAGVWEETETGWQLDWSDQDSAEDVKERKEYRAAVQKTYRKRTALHKRGDHSLCDPRHCKKAVIGNATSNTTSNEIPSTPVPTPREGRGPRCPHNVPDATDGTNGCAKCLEAVYAEHPARMDEETARITGIPAAADPSAKEETA